MDKLCIAGVGLIGGSLARALKASGGWEIVGFDRDEGALRRAVDLGIIDHYTTNPADAVTGADIIVIAVPVGAMKAIFKAIAPHVRPDSVITDVGSTKVSVALDADDAFDGLPAHFVPGHPIAGTECSGVESSVAELFRDRLVILTPLRETRPEAVLKVQALWEQAGAVVHVMDIQHHDRVLAATSHLPHVLAYALVNVAEAQGVAETVFKDEGFRGVTRIASSDPAMWRDICLANREAILNMFVAFSDELVTLAQGIGAGDGPKLTALFSRAKELRERMEHTPAAAASEVHNGAEPIHCLPHLLAFTLVDTLGKMGDPDEILPLAAGGFRDFTQVAASDPRKWTEICLAQREPILNLLVAFSDELNELAKMVAQGEGDRLLGVFSKAKASRDRHVGNPICGRPLEEKFAK